jgi:hypothetical protein
MKDYEKLWKQLQDDMERWSANRNYHDTPMGLTHDNCGEVAEIMMKMEEQS